MNKQYHLTHSKTFCMAPWIHLHTSPTGVAAPCCISKSCSTTTGMGNAKTQSLMEIVNGELMLGDAVIALNKKIGFQFFYF